MHHSETTQYNGSTEDTRVPMPAIYQLWAGTVTPEEVLRVAQKDGSQDAEAYANFYIGLFLEVCTREPAAAQRFFEAASAYPAAGMMGDVMAIHQSLSGGTHGGVPRSQLGGADRPGGSHSVIINGGWQLSSGHHDGMDPLAAMKDMEHALTQGVTTIDCGDIYTGVEEVIGRFLSRHAQRGGDPSRVEIHTKFVPDLDLLGSLDHAYVRQVVRRSLARLRIERLHLVQLHWWDYRVGGHVGAARELLKLQQEGLILGIGTTNYDLEHLRELVEAGIPVVSNQVQLSVLDRRPIATGMCAWCEENGVSLLPYGVLAGGFLSAKWLGAPEPLGDPMDLETRSLTKYKLIIDEFGGWGAFQELLQCLNTIAEGRGDVTISQVAMSWVLQQRSVGGIIVGARSSRHLKGTIAATRIRLTGAELAAIETVQRSGPSGTVYGLERDREGKHGAIMRYNLNKIGGEPQLQELVRRYIHDVVLPLQPAFSRHYGDNLDIIAATTTNAIAVCVGQARRLLAEASILDRSRLDESAQERQRKLIAHMKLVVRELGCRTDEKNMASKDPTLLMPSYTLEQLNETLNRLDRSKADLQRAGQLWQNKKDVPLDVESAVAQARAVVVMEAMKGQKLDAEQALRALSCVAYSACELLETVEFPVPEAFSAATTQRLPELLRVVSRMEKYRGAVGLMAKAAVATLQHCIESFEAKAVHSPISPEVRSMGYLAEKYLSVRAGRLEVPSSTPISQFLASYPDLAELEVVWW